MREIEFLRALEDKTWDTIIAKVPSKEEEPDNGVDFENDLARVAGLLEYANVVLAGQAKHRKVVLFAVYNEDP